MSGSFGTPSLAFEAGKSCKTGREQADFITHALATAATVPHTASRDNPNFGN